VLLPVGQIGTHSVKDLVEHAHAVRCLLGLDAMPNRS
jgi:hypothetical protein